VTRTRPNCVSIRLKSDENNRFFVIARRCPLVWIVPRLELALLACSVLGTPALRHRKWGSENDKAR
jgi:hypothetical protein